METLDAARRWAATWERAWRAQEVDPIAALYAPGATYRSGQFREPEVGGARGYVTRTFGEEADVECWFGAPLVDGRRAAVEWWAAIVETGVEITLAGTTVLTFDDQGLVVDHVDSWMQAEGRHRPFATWANGRVSER